MLAVSFRSKMDITPLFKACAKSAKLQERTVPSAADKKRILKRGNNEFLQEAHRIKAQVTELRNLLVENQAAYLDFASHLKQSPKMSDSERDVVDRETSNILKICLNLVNDFRVECQKRKPSRQFAEHLDGIIDLLMSYLRAIEQIHKHNQETRVQRQLESYRFLKLGAGKKRQPKRAAADSMKLVDGWEDEELEELEKVTRAKPEMQPRKRLSKTPSNLPLDDEEFNQSQSFAEEDEMSPEDLQILELENKQLYTNLQGLADEVEQIEKKVVEIAKLQDLFTEKVKSSRANFTEMAKISFF